MVESNTDYEEFLKQLAENDYVLEEVVDNGHTFRVLFESAINRVSENKQALQKITKKKMDIEFELKSNNDLLHTLQERRMKLDETIKSQSDEISILEKERDETIRKYMETVDHLHDKLTTIKKSFQPETLKEQIADLKNREKEVEIEFGNVIKQKDKLEERMHNLNKDFPSFDALTQIRKEIFDGNDELGKRKRELDNINAFINDIKSKQN